MTEAISTPDRALTLTEAQESAQTFLQSTERAVAEQRSNLNRLRDDLRVLEEVVPIKRAAVDRAQQDYEDTRALLGEAFALYRELMGMPLPK